MQHLSAQETPDLTVERLRARFPGLRSPTVFLDNAGGSQIPDLVADAMRAYLTGSYAQLGGDYPESRAARQTVNQAHADVKTLMNAQGAGEVALGASTSILCHVLAGCYADALPARPERDEIIVSTAGHESDVGPWMRLAQRGFRVRTWSVNPRTLRHEADDLRALLSPRTRLVAFPHVSNLLGDIDDVAGLTRVAHAAGARVLIDGVAFAPHRAMDVAGWGCDWYVYSTYKVFGPHMAAMFGRHEAFAELVGPNHFFIHATEIPYKFELGGVNHEGCAGLCALGAYLRLVAGQDEQTGRPLQRDTVTRAFDVIAALETRLQARLIEYLARKPEVRIIGPAHGGPSRVSTVSFVRAGRSSKAIAIALNAQGLGVRFGSFYSHRLAEQLGLDPADGVVRASLVHYNTLGEVERLIAALDRVL